MGRRKTSRSYKPKKVSHKSVGTATLETKGMSNTVNESKTVVKESEIRKQLREFLSRKCGMKPSHQPHDNYFYIRDGKLEAYIAPTYPNPVLQTACTDGGYVDPSVLDAHVETIKQNIKDHNLNIEIIEDGAGETLEEPVTDKESLYYWVQRLGSPSEVDLDDLAEVLKEEYGIKVIEVDTSSPWSSFMLYDSEQEKDVENLPKGIKDYIEASSVELTPVTYLTSDHTFRSPRIDYYVDEASGYLVTVSADGVHYAPENESWQYSLIKQLGQHPSRALKAIADYSKATGNDIEIDGIPIIDPDNFLIKYDNPDFPDEGFELLEKVEYLGGYKYNAGEVDAYIVKNHTNDTLEVVLTGTSYLQGTRDYVVTPVELDPDDNSTSLDDPSLGRIVDDDETMERIKAIVNGDVRSREVITDAELYKHGKEVIEITNKIQADRINHEFNENMLKDKKVEDAFEMASETQFLTQDPRPNAEKFPSEKNEYVGIEYTLPDHVPPINIDPQHSEGKATSAAMTALFYPIDQLPDNPKFITVRPDADALSAMAILYLRKFARDNPIVPERLERVINSNLSQSELLTLIDQADTHGIHSVIDRVGEYFTEEERENLAVLWQALGSLSSDRNLSLRDRVKMFAELLLGYPSRRTASILRQKIEQAKTERQRIRKNSEITVSSVAHGSDKKVVLVKSPERGAMQLGYEFGDVVIAYNPSFKDPHGNTYAKYTIAKRSPTVPIDLKKVFEELNQLEPGWGGSPSIGGSPQGQSSNLPPEKVLEIVKKHYASA